MSDAPADPAAGVSREAHEAIDRLVALIATDPEAPTSVTDPAEVVDVHVRDSLAALEVPAFPSARELADLGAGAGLPGLVLAAALPACRVHLVESNAKKCAFMERAVGEMGLTNAAVVNARAEEWEAGAERCDVVTARAVGPLVVLAELASPLLREGGELVAWKGRRDAEEESGAARAAGRLAMEPVEVRKVRPYPASRDRHIHVLRKNGPTPAGLPRRPGMAAKRPFGSE